MPTSETDTMRRDRARALRPFVSDRWLLSHILWPGTEVMNHDRYRLTDATCSQVVEDILA